MPFLYKCEIFRKTFTRSIYFSLLPRSENSKRSEIQKKWQMSRKASRVS